MIPSKTQHSRMRWAAAVLVPAVLSGCSVGPEYQTPPPPSDQAYARTSQPRETVSASGNAGAAQQFNPKLDMPAQWWQLFQSPELDRMVREALEHSPTLTQAVTRLTQAQEEASARIGATRYPSMTANVSAQREKVNTSALGVPFPSPPPFNLLNGSVAVSYHLDLFGGNRRLAESLNAQVEYEKWQVQGARLMLAGNVVSTAIRQAQLRSQIDITRKLIGLEKRTLAIMEHRFRAGGISEYDVRSQHTALAQVQASLPQLENQLDLANHQLAVLMGETPQEASVEEINLDSLSLPQELPMSLPSSMVRQRPDIRGAEALLHQACANVGVATANLYPQIDITGSAGGVGTSFANGGPVWAFGAGLAQPLFQGGALRAERRKAVAAYEEAGSAYRETVLQAFREVADALCAIEHDAQALQARSEASAQAEGAYQIASRRFDAGGISQVALLDAQRQELQTALDHVASQAARYSDSATLFQALGGGWWNEERADGRNPTPPGRQP